MLEIVWVLLFIFAILVLIMAIEYTEHYKNPFWGFIFIVIDILLWFILALSQLKIEVPWEMYNASSESIETGTHVVTSSVSPYLTYMFSGIGVIMIIYLVYALFSAFRTK